MQLKAVCSGLDRLETGARLRDTVSAKKTVHCECTLAVVMLSCRNPETTSVELGVSKLCIRFLEFLGNQPPHL